MSSVYLNSPPSPFPFIQLKEDHRQMHFFTTPQHQASSSLSSSISFNITDQDQRASDHSIEPQKDSDQYIFQNRSSDHRLQQASSIHPLTVENANDKIGALSICEVEGEVEDKRDYESANWTSKKMNTGSEKKEKIIKIKIRDIQKKDFHCETTSPANSSNSNIIRICSDCKTTKTPLWRSGPQGPKSLCNACGIRQRKARRAMLTAAAAAADANETVLPTDNWTRTYKVQKKEKKSRTSYHMAPYKKPFGPPHQWGGRISFEDFAMSLSKSLAFRRRAFPKDDQEEAAILLMALSCGLLHS